MLALGVQHHVIMIIASISANFFKIRLRLSRALGAFLFSVILTVMGDANKYDELYFDCEMRIEDAWNTRMAMMS